MTNATKHRPATHPTTWYGVSLKIVHRCDYIFPGTDHIDTYVISPKGARLPITETGYLSHFIDARALVDGGGAVAFVLAWCDREAKSKEWQKQEAACAQKDLFR